MAPSPTVAYGESDGLLLIEAPNKIDAPKASAGHKPNLVRVEGSDSIGRTYASGDHMLEPGLGAKRRALTSVTHAAPNPTVKSLTNKHVNLSKSTREDILAYFRNTWDLSDTLFTGLKNDSVFFMVPDKLRRPLTFYYAHVAATYINKLNLAGLVDHVDYFLQKLYETGVDEMSWDDMDAMQEEDFKWPDLSEAIAFKDNCKVVIEKVIANLTPPCEKPITMDDPLWSLFMGFDHERIHLETSSVLMRQLPIDAVVRPKDWQYAPSNASTPDEAPCNTLLHVAAGKAVLGKPRDFPSFGWDNEYGRREVDVPAFEASKFLVTNAEFLPFVLAGGYKDKTWWISEAGDDEGWRWTSYRHATHPSFWVATKDMPEFFGGTPTYPYQKDDGHECAGSGKEFKYRAMWDIIDMPWDWPADVNYHEAKAFCRWKSANDGGRTYRVPTEAEWHLMRGATDLTTADPDADIIMREEAPGNINLRFGSSSPVDMFPPSPAGFYDTHGNVWEYVEDHFAPLPGGEIHYLYDDFSAPCYDGWHTMMMGGSWISTGDEASNFARFHFRRHFFQHLGFRYVRTSQAEEWPGEHTVANLWEGKVKTNNAVLNDYASTDDRFALFKTIDLTASMDYQKNVAALCKSVVTNLSVPNVALDLGCATGNTAFELTGVFDFVVGADSSNGLVQQARLLQHHGEVRYERPEEGVIMKEMLARVSTQAHRDNVQFLNMDLGTVSQAKLQAAAAVHTQFDCVLVEDVLDKLVQPLHFVRELASLLQPGGVLVILSGNDWTKEKTPRNSWMGGFMLNGETMRTIDMLKSVLKRQLVFQRSQDVPRMIRNHDRNYEVKILEATIWKKPLMQ